MFLKQLNVQLGLRKRKLPDEVTLFEHQFKEKKKRKLEEKKKGKKKKTGRS